MGNVTSVNSSESSSSEDSTFTTETSSYIDSNTSLHTSISAEEISQSKVHVVKVKRCPNTGMFGIKLTQREDGVYVTQFNLEGLPIVDQGILSVNDRLMKINDFDMSDKTIHTAMRYFALCSTECQLTVFRDTSEQKNKTAVNTPQISQRQLLINELSSMNNEEEIEHVCRQALLFINQSKIQTEA
ncbi:hypothetical protein M3Y96_00207000 [Aphelenchoides besseyi]|nr:hypothetical protein M3Y96_00207000 [Aphelenchoides besseyi]